MTSKLYKNQIRKRLVILYGVHTDYEKVKTNKEKKDIRLEYEKRFKRNFYKDRAYFKKVGNPQNMEIITTHYKLENVNQQKEYLVSNKFEKRAIVKLERIRKGEKLVLIEIQRLINKQVRNVKPEEIIEMYEGLYTRLKRYNNQRKALKIRDHYKEVTKKITTSDVHLIITFIVKGQFQSVSSGYKPFKHAKTDIKNKYNQIVSELMSLTEEGKGIKKKLNPYLIQKFGGNIDVKKIKVNKISIQKRTSIQLSEGLIREGRIKIYTRIAKSLTVL